MITTTPGNPLSSREALDKSRVLKSVDFAQKSLTLREKVAGGGRT